MATYYVSPYGDDTNNNGKGADPTNVLNKPYATLGKLIGTSGVAVAGDKIYICPGVYRGTISTNVSGSSGSFIEVIGDPTNESGFKDSNGDLVPGGEVRLTSWLSDKTAPSSGNFLDINGDSYFKFSNIWFVMAQPSSNQGCIYMHGGAHDVSFFSCAFSHGMGVGSSYPLIGAINTLTQLAINLTLDSCTMLSCGGRIVGVTLFTTTNAGDADYDSGILIKNCLFMGGSSHVRIISSGTNSSQGGGVEVYNCTFFESTGSAIEIGSNISTVNPLKIYNSVVVAPLGTVFNVASGTQITEDYNVYTGNVGNATAGTHSTSDGSNCLMLDFGQWRHWGQYPRAFLTPTVGSVQLGYGNFDNSIKTDWLQRARPEGGRSINNAVGYVERHDTGEKESTVVDAGTAIRLTGPASQILQFPVTSPSSIFSVKCRYDSDHGTTNPPTVTLLSAPPFGILDNYNGSGINQILTAGGSTDTWETLTSSQLSPTANGVLSVILSSRSAAPSGHAYFDTFSVT